MAKKAAAKEPNTSREGKVYQLRKSAIRAAKEDGVKPGNFTVKESVRKDGWYYMKNSSMHETSEGIAEEVMADTTPEEMAELKEMEEKETKAFSEGVIADHGEHLPNEAILETLKKVEKKATIGSEVILSPAKGVRNDPSQLVAVDVTKQIGDRIQDVVKAANKVLAEEPPPLPSELAQQNKQRGPRSKIPVTHRSTIESPTKLVWHIADEMMAQNPQTTRKQVMVECVRRGIAFYTARTQYQQWYTAQQESKRR